LILRFFEGPTVAIRCYSITFFYFLFFFPVKKKKIGCAQHHLQLLYFCTYMHIVLLLLLLLCKQYCFLHLVLPIGGLIRTYTVD
jgi:hypothetical protein